MGLRFMPKCVISLAMKRILPLFLCLFTFASTSPIKSSWDETKKKPDYIGIAQELRSYEIMYAIDAEIHGIKFKQPVTMGFKTTKMKLRKGSIVGLCTYGNYFREIDINQEYWDQSSWESKRTLIYHEMTHCMCGRQHTWRGGVYPEDGPDNELRFRENRLKFYELPKGFLPDQCPASIMYPYVVSDECAIKHWSFYEDEMFDDCVPY